LTIATKRMDGWIISSACVKRRQEKTRLLKYHFLVFSEVDEDILGCLALLSPSVVLSLEDIVDKTGDKMDRQLVVKFEKPSTRYQPCQFDFPVI